MDMVYIFIGVIIGWLIASDAQLMRQEEEVGELMSALQKDIHFLRNVIEENMKDE